MIISVYALVVAGAIFLLWQKSVTARKKDDFHWKIFFYKMWEGTVANILCGWILTYVIVDAQWDDMKLWIARTIGLVFGYAGSYLLNKLIRNGQASTDSIKDKLNLP